MAGTHGSRERTQTRREDRKKMRRGWGRAVANRALQELRRRKVARSPFHFWNAEPIVERLKKYAAFCAFKRRGASQATYENHAVKTRRDTTRP